MLESIRNPQDLRRLSQQETQMLAQEIRQALIDAVAHTGGHLASNLGTVELTLALHRVLDTPMDKIVFDVGHQSYTHKLLTGRQALLETLRQEGGMSGFPKRSESIYDVFETGHASTAISAAVGLARARDLRGEGHTVVAVVGDGALTGGMCYEALNDAGSRPTKLIVVLNDNEMSIAKNVGALSKYLTRLRGSKGWIGTKRSVKRGLRRIPLVGAPLFNLMEHLKRSLKLMLVPGEFFEALGFGYLGPIDGHDIQTVERVLRDARQMDHPVVIHVVTQKGRGYELAERQPEKFHGVAPFFVESGQSRTPAAQEASVSAGSVVSDAMLAAAKESAQVVGITAAMPYGTGMAAFAKRYPDRFFDVGIAEEHAVTMAAGLAAGGMRPVFAVYASFLQRACDQLLHDVCLQALPVTVLVDHAGFVSGDGATHQGVYDLSMLRAMPNLTIWAPCDARELAAMVRAAVKLPGPCVVRYAKQLPKALGGELGEIGAWRRIEGEAGVPILAHGHAVETALETAALLREASVPCTVWSASSIAPLDTGALDALAGEPLLVVLEEAQRGGLSEAVAGHFAARAARPRLLLEAISGIVPSAHSLQGLEAECGLDAHSLASKIQEAWHGAKA